MKHASLFLLTLQNVASILLLRYVRTTTGPRFLNTTAVFNSEIQKTIFSVLLLISEERSVVQGFKVIYAKVICQWEDTIKTGIPALLYTIQNNLLFLSISNLDAATFQVRRAERPNDEPCRALGQLPVEDIHDCFVYGAHSPSLVESGAMVRVVPAVSGYFSCAIGKYDFDHGQERRERHARLLLRPRRL